MGDLEYTGAPDNEWKVLWQRQSDLLKHSVNVRVRLSWNTSSPTYQLCGNGEIT